MKIMVHSGLYKPTKWIYINNVKIAQIEMGS